MNLTVQSVRDLVWANAEHTIFSCLVKFAEFGEELPFGCASGDLYEHTQEIWDKANAGEYGAIAEYVATPAAPIAPAGTQPTTSGAQTI